MSEPSKEARSVAAAWLNEGLDVNTLAQLLETQADEFFLRGEARGLERAAQYVGTRYGPWDAAMGQEEAVAWIKRSWAFGIRALKPEGRPR